MRALTQEFKTFLLKGNAVDMAVGFIFGAAFATVIKSFVNNIIMPPIGVLTGGVDFSDLAISLGGEASIGYGLFINDLIAFVILGFVVFVMIKLINNLHRKEDEPKEEPKTPEDIELLREIRDSLKK